MFQRKLFVEFLRKKNQDELALKVEGVKPEILIMTWIEPQNILNYAIYTMCHMETYMGERGSMWKHGLNSGISKQLKYLRAGALCNKPRRQITNDAAETCLNVQKKSKSKIDFTKK